MECQTARCFPLGAVQYRMFSASCAYARSHGAFLTCPPGPTSVVQFREEIQQNLHEITRLHILLQDGELQSKTANAYIEEVRDLFPSLFLLATECFFCM